ncbi:DUF1441 family protein [Tropicibacter sp. R15_0]|uniref:DUF1441 family protein n=1 Tax=Tropicibacter sp. R15_0 TaxID=2821101 RepID=UPI001ADD2FA8|nr:DUF1441 family protein [Tropicibacter sp. R15_0]MBO9467052.1 DUF1441 family protein [Tropicibacter sp. R15_0]
MDRDAINPLQPLTADQVALVERFPLPEGVPDALVSKAQLETALGVSGTTISAWLRRAPNPIPYETAGANGRAYEFRLSVAYAWMQAMRADEESAKSAADAAAAQLSLALLGGESAAGAPGKMSLADQRKLIELEALRRTEALQRGDLIRFEDVVSGIEEIFAAIRDGLDALPDRLARELGLQGRDLEKIERACDDVLGRAAQNVQEVIGNGEEGRGSI